jgi:hypothetical protein
MSDNNWLLPFREKTGHDKRTSFALAFGVAEHKITKLDELMPWRYAEA